MRMMAVERRRRAPKRHHRAGNGRDLGGTVVEIVGPAQYPQPSTRLFPDWVHIEQQRDQLCRRIGMDAPILAVTVPAHRYHRRPSGQVDCEFSLDFATQRLAFKFGGEPGECRTTRDRLKRETAALLDVWKAGDETRYMLLADKILDDDEVERL